MNRTIVGKWRKLTLKKMVTYLIPFLGLLLTAFQVGVLVGGKNTEAKVEFYKITENRLKQEIESERRTSKDTISDLRNKIQSLKTETVKLKDKLSVAEQRYDKLLIRFQEVTKNFHAMKDINTRLKTKYSKLKKILYANRPFLDYIMKIDSEGWVNFFVYNKSKVPLKIITTDYQCWENGIKGKKHDGVKSIILFPDKNNVRFSFHLTPDDISKLKSGKIDFRGGLCTKYTTLNKDDNRYWLYELWFIYDSTNKEYNVVKAIDNRVGSKKQCNIEKMIPNGWFEH